MKKLILKVCLAAFLVVCFNYPVLRSEESNQTFDKYGGFTGVKGEITGYFHTEKIKDRWWLITPKGNAFFSVGMYCVRVSGIPETKTGKRAYRENCLKKYGSEAKWAEVTIKRLKDWGFNTLGDWSSFSVIRKKQMPYVIGLELGNVGKNVIKNAYGFFPDVFDPDYKQKVVSKVGKRLETLRCINITKDPYLLGYYTSDESSWYGSRQRHGALVDDFIALMPDDAGKIAWKDFIERRYKRVPFLNTAWNKKYSSFDELLTVYSVKGGEFIEKDKLKFMGIIAEQFACVQYDAIKSFDSNHLILGSRPSRDYPEVIKGLGKYTDVFGISYYSLNQGYNISSKFEEAINYLYETSGKPLMLGVLITARDTALPYGMVKTQKDRGISYWQYLKKVASSPNIIGIHWFQYFDPPRRCYDKKAANWGLVNDKDNPYNECVKLVADANRSVYAYLLNVSSYFPQFDFNKGKNANPNHSKTKKILIPNADFEKGRQNWLFQAWKGTPKIEIDKKEIHKGKYALKITGYKEKWDSVGAAVQNRPRIILIPGVVYRLSGWMKTNMVNDSAFIRLKVLYGDKDIEYFETEKSYGTRAWHKVEVEFSPKSVSRVGYLNIQLVGKGTVWVDDLNLEIINK